MDSSSRIGAALVTPGKEKSSRSNPSKFDEEKRSSENLNPNVSIPNVKPSDSPLMIKSGKSPKKPASRNPNQVASPFSKKNIRERKFVIARKKSRNEELNCSTASVFCEKCEKAIGKSKCLCLAYQSLRASQEEFFKIDTDFNSERLKECGGGNDEEETGIFNEGEREGNDSSTGKNGEDDELGMKRSRERLLEEARESGPEAGSGRVMHLVKAFENLLSLPKADDSGVGESEEVKDEKKSIVWALPGLQQPTKDCKLQVSTPSCPSDFYLTLESLGLDSTRSYSLGSSKGSISISTRTSGVGGRSRRSSNESSGALARRHHKRRNLKATSQKPFILKTEQRGKCKEEEFMKKLQQMKEEEQRLRIPIAQGLPWTTDEPECLLKPPVKESTRSIDVVLHSDIRAEERAEFDHQLAQKMSYIEHMRAERERRQKQEEEEEIRRLRKEIIPKAQPMPYFDRPFVPRRSTKHPTIPREPKFHLPKHKKIKCCLSCDDNCSEYNC